MPPENPHQGQTAIASTPSSTSEGKYSVAQAGDAAPELTPGRAVSNRDDVGTFADAIQRADMVGPALIALRIAGPLSWIGGQMLWAVQPIVQGLRVGPGKVADTADTGAGGVVSRLARFLEGEGNVAELVAHLEAESVTRSAKRKGSHKSTGENNGPV